MYDSASTPPSSQILRDEVIGHVSQRSRPVHYNFDPRWQYLQPQQNATDNAAPDQNMSHPIAKATSVSKGKRKVLSSVDVAAPECQVRGFQEMDSTANSTRTRYRVEDWAVMVIDEKMKLRELRRDNQRRYRQKNLERKLSLAKATRQLLQEIKALEKHRDNVFASLPTLETVWTVAVEYFRVFRFGSSPSGPCGQLEFIRSTMAPDVLVNAGQGAEALLAHWRRCSFWFQDVDVELQNLEKDAIDSLVGTTKTSFTITESTLRNVFPHLCGHSSQVGARSLLADKLRNQRLVVAGTVRFVWDSACGRVTSVMSSSDMLAPMLQLVGDVQSLAQVFEHARISSNFELSIS
ncbi:hypothetical protein PHYPSEUDO_012213 [Phytophthora pseudosyringae]|uniref:BZIP domain-containing protein n=1 Tax=Phytophthora pseudosyringae TaxID=221518 RepID=A0A8T1W5N0_9STRA|nr:hypothetical protein PHYPSEUDO_012213 [Phytophthora pseudosyringae]